MTRWEVAEHHYCLCGAHLDVASDSRRAVVDVAAIFWHTHQGEGHGSTDVATARNARRRARRRFDGESG